MADIFISYAREDAAAAEWIAKRAMKNGYSVFWDRDLLAGADIHAAIRREIMEAKRVLVIWSRNSVGSRWVLDEADLAVRHKKLMPVCIDNSEPPLGFGVYNVKYMRDWDSDFRRVLKGMPPKTVAYTMSHVVQDAKGLDKREIRSLVHGFSSESVMRTAEQLSSNGFDSYASLFKELGSAYELLTGGPTVPLGAKARQPTDSLFLPRVLAGIFDLFAIALPWYGSVKLIGYSTTLTDLLAFAFVWVLYHFISFAITGRGQTLGSLIAATQTVRARDGGRPGAMRAIPLALVSLLPFSFLWYFVDKRQRMLHNIASGTIVVSS